MRQASVPGLKFESNLEFENLAPQVGLEPQAPAR